MNSTGGRASMQATWSVAAEPTTGVISSIDLDMKFDSGCTDGAGVAGDLGMALQWSDNCYRHADFAASGTIYNSGRAGNTSCRAPGVIASVPFHEDAIEQTAEALNLPAEQVREANMYRVGDVTPKVCGGQTLGEGGFNWTVPALWAKAKAEWDVAKRRDAIAAFNGANRWRKRGLCMMPIKYGISLWDYQMAVTVKIFWDGTVQVTHGGAEVGQGINTKVAQAVAYGLGCPLDLVTVGDLSSLESPNCTATGGSGTSETSCAAALIACRTLHDALAPYRSAGDWAKVIATASDDRVGLFATGWWEQAKGEQFTYATQGVGCVEVELDALTGEIQISRADVVMDQGTPLNPEIDLGQAEGGFIMALGYYLTEEVLFDGANKQINLGTWQYKPPAAHDIPLELNIEFLGKAPNPAKSAVLGSKASAEPPMALGAAAFFAARQAIRAARADAGEKGAFGLEAPLTVERIQTACLATADRFTLR